MCGDALLVAPIVRAGGEVEVALPPGGWFDLNTRQRLAGPAGGALSREARPVPGVRARRLRAAARPRRAAHGRDRRGAPLELLWVFGKPTVALAGFAQARIERCRRRHVRGPRRARRQRRAVGRRRRPAGRATLGRRRMLEKPTLAVTVGEPAGIGPELCAMLAARHASRTRSLRASWSSAISALLARARATHRPRAALRRVRSGRVRAGRRRGRGLAPPARRAGDARAHPIPPTRTACCTMLAERDRRVRDRRVRGARHRADAEERDAWTPASRSPGTPNIWRSARTRRAS